ncbi:Stp1/IreP family PP2C-type Ser/Thr phosphatase [Alteribacillus sp. YIM 98480]|uniref:Stp1/IreP family PP2C-type Ser/Thr phosphatase n=1 Tax=Alteribacillus sp. YIM 98480 TaxID=2606599 RepID=UPI00131C0768|nr:Stp1/IreP family PP2C-type Ser/Thr phosphatase [Alteribacillus sp. YIM 98480]
MDTVFLTDAGKVRDHNEDAGGIFINKAGEYLAVVADGMGGHQAGDIASKMTTDLLSQAWESLEKSLTPEEAGEWLSVKIDEVNQKVFDKAKENSHLQGMGTTLVAAVCTPSFIVIAHVGDSRAYLLTEQALQLKTQDHSLVNELKKSGQLTEEEAENHPRKNILTRALGTEPIIKSEKMALEWNQGNAVILCSDGLTNKLTDEEIKQELCSKQSLDDSAKILIHTANERGGEDNITLAVVINVPLEEGMM